jgi:hypothetical protein
MVTCCFEMPSQVGEFLPNGSRMRSKFASKLCRTLMPYLHFRNLEDHLQQRGTGLWFKYGNSEHCSIDSQKLLRSGSPSTSIALHITLPSTS